MLYRFSYSFFFTQAKRKVSTGVITQVLTVIFDEWKSSERRQISHSKCNASDAFHWFYLFISAHQRGRKKVTFLLIKKNSRWNNFFFFRRIILLIFFICKQNIITFVFKVLNSLTREKSWDGKVKKNICVFLLE